MVVEGFQRREKLRHNVRLPLPAGIMVADQHASGLAGVSRSLSSCQRRPDHVLGVAFANWPKASSAWLAYITEGPAPI